MAITNTELKNKVLKSVTHENFSDEQIQIDYPDVQVELNTLETDYSTFKTNTNEQLAEMTTQVDAIDRGIGGTYASLSAIQTAFPTGNDKRYVASDNGEWYFWNGSAWTSGGIFQGIGIANETVNAMKIDDYIYKNIVNVEKALGSNINNTIIDQKTLTSITSISGTRVNRTRIIEAPATDNGILTLYARCIDSGDLTVLILEKGENNQFRTVKKQIISVVAGENFIETNLIINVGQYVGIYSYDRIYFSTVTDKSSYSYSGEIGQTYVDTTSYTIYDFAYYYKIGGKPNNIEQLKINTDNLNAELLLYDTTPSVVDQKDLATHTSTSNDGAEGTYRVNSNPSPSTGKLKLHGNFSSISIVEIFILERQDVNLNLFRKVSSETVSVVVGINAIETNLIILEGQYVAVVSKANLKYKTVTGGLSFSLAKVDITNYTSLTKSTTLDYGFYYEVVESTRKIKSIEDNITEINSKIDNLQKNYKAINTIYIEKFIGTVLPTPPFGAWSINGGGTISDGVTLPPMSDLTSYLELNQSMHFDSDGIKWRVRIDDIASRIRLQRFHATQGSIVELDNGVLKIYDITGTSVLAQKTIAFTLVVGREYNLSLEVFAEILTLRIGDTVSGEIDSVSYISTGKGTAYAGRAWNNPRIYNASGSFKVLQFDYFSKLPRSPKIVVLGDSILEGDTIRNESGGGYTRRWAGLLYEELKGDMAILGTAGETSTGIISKLPIIEKAFREPEYVLLAHMTNDTTFATWQTNTEQLIAWAESIKAIPVICMMPMRAGREPFYDAVLDYVIKSPYKIIWFNKALTINGDGKTHDSQYYLADDLHPNVLGHAKMFEQSKVDLEEVFQLN